MPWRWQLFLANLDQLVDGAAGEAESFLGLERTLTLAAVG